MKKIFLFATLLGVALTSCVKDELSQEAKQQSKIVFDTPVVSPSTKVAEVTTANINGSFGVWAKYYATGGYTTYSAGSDYMTDVKVIAPASGDIWNTEGDYYWPKTGSLSFIAYYPYKTDLPAGTSVSASGKGISITNYTVVQTLANQKDLLFSEMNYDQNKDNKLGDAEAVQMSFKHALSSIRFAVVAEADYGTTTLTVNSIKILNAKSVGNFVQGLDDAKNSQTPQLVIVTADGVDKGKLVYSDATFCWTGQTTPLDYNTVIHDDAKSLTTSAKYIHDGKNVSGHTADDITDLILLPQNLNGVELEVQYQLYNPHTALTTYHTATLPLYNNKGTENTTNDRVIEYWERGKRYTYTITIGLDKIQFTPSVDAWKDIVVGSGI